MFGPSGDLATQKLRYLVEKLNERKQKLEQEAECIEDDLCMLREYVLHDSIIDSHVCVFLDLRGDLATQKTTWIIDPILLPSELDPDPHSSRRRPT